MVKVPSPNTCETTTGRPKLKSRFIAKLMDMKRKKLSEKSQKWGFDFEKEVPCQNSECDSDPLQKA